MTLRSSTHSLDMVYCNNAHPAPRGQRNGSRSFSETCYRFLAARYRFFAQYPGKDRTRLLGNVGQTIYAKPISNSSLWAMSQSSCGKHYAGAKTTPASLIVRHVFPKGEFGMRTKNGIH
jgi:hypothetical protein